MEDIHLKISMRCSVCGNDQFSLVDENMSMENLAEAPVETQVRCSDCGTVTTKEQLIEDNRGAIDANLHDLKDDAAKMVEKEFKKIEKKFRNLFK